MKNHKYIWRRPVGFTPKHYYRLTAPTTLKSVDLRPLDDPVYDQGNEGSCTANSGAGAFSHEQNFAKATDKIIPARQFIYSNEVYEEGSPGQDTGGSLAATVQVMEKYGVCDEQYYPYSTELGTQPSATAVADASNHKVKQAQSINQTANDINTALADGYTVMFGTDITSSFESIGSDGIWDTSNVDNESILGGHALLIVGYLENGNYIIRNSWGIGWGDNGYCYIPSSWILSPSCSDFWILTNIA